MAIKAIAHSYWRSIQRGSRTFASIPESVREDVRTLARGDVTCGVITPEDYEHYIGEGFPV